LLLKFLFPEEKLSVQVHPDDATAQRFGEPWGKTECWYLAHAKPRESQVALGLKPGYGALDSSKASMKSCEELLTGSTVYQGEMIYVPADGAYAWTQGPSSWKRSSSPTPPIVSTTTDARAAASGAWLASVK